jgi:hypothetical protein
VDRCGICCIDRGGPQRCGAAGSWLLTHVDGRAQGGGVICHPSGIDERHGKVNVLIPPEDGLAEDCSGGF